MDNPEPTSDPATFLTEMLQSRRTELGYPKAGETETPKRIRPFEGIDWAQVGKRNEEARIQELAVARMKRLESLRVDAGTRYRYEDLGTYQTYDDAQASVLDAMKRYSAEITANVAECVGIVLFGPTGTGKDHLLIGVAKEAIDRDCRSVRMVRGAFLGQEIRDSFDSKESERGIVGKYASPDVLIFSDPIPGVGELKDFQADVTHRIIESRYCNKRPTFVSINAADEAEAQKRLGVATWDRLRHNALVLPCRWESFRAR